MQNLKPRLPRHVAKARGIPRFYTGKPCARGHIADRVTASGNCLHCQRIANANHYQSALKLRRKTDLADRVRQQGQTYLQKHADSVKERRRARYAARREEMIARRRSYYENNLPAIAATNRRMVANRLRRVPPWLTREHAAQIVELYRTAARLSAQTGIKHHVDHIVPLQGKTVSGLHVPWNLRVITAEDNLRKGNRHE